MSAWFVVVLASEQKDREVVNITDPSGNTYYGEYVGGRANGFGFQTWKNGAVAFFIGQWKDGFRLNGKSTYRNGDTYEGDYKKGQRDGRGEQISPSRKYIYSGQWSNDQPNGFGLQVLSGVKYEGHWENGKKHGAGKQTNADGDVFAGEWRHSKPIKWTWTRNVATKMKGIERTKRFQTPSSKENKESSGESEEVDPDEYQHLLQ